IPFSRSASRLQELPLTLKHVRQQNPERVDRSLFVTVGQAYPTAIFTGCSSRSPESTHRKLRMEMDSASGSLSQTDPFGPTTER
ncbi:MAG: hypothetical protein AAFN41_03520, partial [Planctomycetota bacterium]